MKCALIPSSPVGHLDTVTMLKYAETNKRGSAMKKAFLIRGKKKFLILYHESASRVNVILVPFLDILLVI